MKKRLIAFAKWSGIAAAVVLGLLVTEVDAQFGGIVFDPTSSAQLGTIVTSQAATVAKLIAEYNQLVQIYTNEVQQYNQALAMAQRFSNPQRLGWLTLAETGVNDYTRNSYGETINWPTMINGSPQFAQGAWTNATIAINSNPYLAATQTMGSSARLADLASVEAVDGSSTKCLSTVAAYRQDEQRNANAYASLQAAELDDSTATNSEIEQLNLINAGQSQATNEMRSQGAVHACLVEQQIIANKIQRDAITQHMNFLTQAEQFTATEGNGWGGAAEALAH